MWNLFLWKTTGPVFPPQALWKSQNSPTPACGKKSVGAVKQKTLFHINFPYGCYCYKNLWININIDLYLTRKEPDYALYL